MRAAALACVLVVVGSGEADAEWQIKPFVGIAFAGNTTFVDLEDAVGSPHLTFGASALLLGDIFGVEADFGHSPGFFQGDGRLVLQSDATLVQSSSVTTLSGSLVVALPRRMAEYGLRPYVVGGAGMMHVRTSHQLSVLEVSSTLPAFQVGGGVTGFLTDRFGFSWDVRHIRSFGGSERGGVSFGPEQLSFWRATMALAIRY